MSSHVGAYLAVLLCSFAAALPPPEGPTVPPHFPLLPNCTVAPCDGPLAEFYCHGPVLGLAWKLLGSGKNCTGTGLATEPALAKRAADNLGKNPSPKEFLAFCNEYFTHAHYLESANLSDWTPKPPLIKGIKDQRLRRAALRIHGLWRNLSRSFRSEVARRKDRYPIIAVPHPFIVPGGDFDVYFYWDSYWILRGLRVSAMKETSRGILLNFAELILHLGYVPNGGQYILSKRSQPPYFAPMVAEYLEAYGWDAELARRLLPALDAEADWWLRHRSLKASGRRVFHYSTAMNCPRPEAYAQDISDALGSERRNTIVWANIASGAESGWDFSARWFGSGGGKASILTSSILPVDLNTRLTANFAILAELHHKAFANQSIVEYYSNLAKDGRQTLLELFYSTAAGAWLDQEMAEDGALRPREAFYPSNLEPLLLGGWNESILEAAGDYAEQSGAFVLPGGVPTSFDESSGQQWDWPNVWPPLVHNLVIGLRKDKHPRLLRLARHVAATFVSSVLKNFHGGFLWEKYDARFPGEPGGGGEYEVEKGFGWTNGVVLDLIRIYAEEGLEKDFYGWKKPGAFWPYILIFVAVLLLIVSCVLVWLRRRGREERRRAAALGAYHTIEVANRVLYSDMADSDDTESDSIS